MFGLGLVWPYLAVCTGFSGTMGPETEIAMAFIVWLYLIEAYHSVCVAILAYRVGEWCKV